MKHNKPPLYVGLDLGQKTVGIAISDPSFVIAMPLNTIRFIDYDYDSAVQQLKDFLKEYNVKKLIIGVPLKNSTENNRTLQEINKFIQIIESNIQLPIIKMDETNSTKLTLNKNSDKRQDWKKDEKAAAYILQSYLQTL